MTDPGQDPFRDSHWEGDDPDETANGNFGPGGTGRPGRPPSKSQPSFQNEAHPGPADVPDRETCMKN